MDCPVRLRQRTVPVPWLRRGEEGSETRYWQWLLQLPGGAAGREAGGAGACVSVRVVDRGTSVSFGGDVDDVHPAQNTLPNTRNAMTRIQTPVFIDSMIVQGA